MLPRGVEGDEDEAGGGSEEGDVEGGGGGGGGGGEEITVANGDPSCIKAVECVCL